MLNSHVYEMAQGAVEIRLDRCNTTILYHVGKEAVPRKRVAAQKAMLSAVHRAADMGHFSVGDNVADVRGCPIDLMNSVAVALH
ncbi:hypothetical protein MHYP_G00078310 [Metynnis hypsauchen]